MDPATVIVSARTDGENLQCWKKYGCHTTTDNGNLLLTQMHVPNSLFYNVNVTIQNLLNHG